jgi:hypothetical protein
MSSFVFPSGGADEHLLMVSGQVVPTGSVRHGLAHRCYVGGALNVVLLMAQWRNTLFTDDICVCVSVLASTFLLQLCFWVHDHNRSTSATQPFYIRHPHGRVRPELRSLFLSRVAVHKGGRPTGSGSVGAAVVSTAGSGALDDDEESFGGFADVTADKSSASSGSVLTCLRRNPRSVCAPRPQLQCGVGCFGIPCLRTKLVVTECCSFPS